MRLHCTFLSEHALVKTIRLKSREHVGSHTVLKICFIKVMWIWVWHPNTK